MPKAVVLRETGAAEKLTIEEVPIKKPGPDEVIIRHKVIGINYIDVYQRQGLYKLQGEHPIPGIEAVGVVEAFGSNIEMLKEGDRVGFLAAPAGGYAEMSVVHRDHIVPIPPEITDEQAAAVMTKGMTALYLTYRTYPLQDFSRILVYSAAGGVGQLVCQMAKHKKTTVIGLVGMDEKKSIAQNCGCDHVLNYESEDVVAKVNELTDGKGVHVVYDGVGQATFDQSLACIARLGLMVSYGQSSGAVETVPMQKLAERSLYITRPSLFDYTRNYMEQILMVANLFAMVDKKEIKPMIGKTYQGLESIIEAHHNLESRKTVGSGIVVL